MILLPTVHAVRQIKKYGTGKDLHILQLPAVIQITKAPVAIHAGAFLFD